MIADASLVPYKMQNVQLIGIGGGGGVLLESSTVSSANRFAFFNHPSLYIEQVAPISRRSCCRVKNQAVHDFFSSH